MPRARYTARVRGPHPDDPTAFGDAALPTLRRAADELRWLLGRGYPLPSALGTVGNHHQLTERQRMALSRTCAAPNAAVERARRRLEPNTLRGGELHIDALNLIIGLEVALAGGPLLRGDDGTLRDLAGLRGSYHVLDETRSAVRLIQASLRALAVSSVQWWLDAPVSNSGRLRALLLATESSWSATLVPDADRALEGRAQVVSADALVLDRCQTWFDLGSLVVDAHVPSAWVIDLCAE